jgi:hypothetical protein
MDTTIRKPMPLEEVMKIIRTKNKGYRSVENDRCAYRANDGNCCLVGAFIPDDKYKTSMERKSAYQVITGYDLDEYMPFDSTTMHRIQLFHDARISKSLEGEEFYKTIENFLKTTIYKDN